MQQKYNRLVPFLKDLYREVNNSGKSFYEFFEMRDENIENFKDSDLFKKHLKQYPEHGEIINTLFPKMRKDFEDGVAYLYYPDGNGSYSNEQNTVFYKLADFLTLKSGAATTPPSPTQTIADTTKLMREAGNLVIEEPLKLNKKTGFIEGKIRNPNDPFGESLGIYIDPNRPEEIGLRIKNKQMFLIENSPSGIGIFIGASSEEILEFTGQTTTQTTTPTTQTTTPQEESDTQIQQYEIQQYEIQHGIQQAEREQPAVSEPSPGKSEQEQTNLTLPNLTLPNLALRTKERLEQIRPAKMAPRIVTGGRERVYKEIDFTGEDTRLRLPNYVAQMKKGRTKEEKLKQKEQEQPQAQPRPQTKEAPEAAETPGIGTKKKSKKGKAVAIGVAVFTGASIPVFSFLTDII